MTEAMTVQREQNGHRGAFYIEKDGARAARCMADHLMHIEHTLNFDVADADPPEIESLFD